MTENQPSSTSRIVRPWLLVSLGLAMAVVGLGFLLFSKDNKRAGQSVPLAVATKPPSVQAQPGTPVPSSSQAAVPPAKAAVSVAETLPPGISADPMDTFSWDGKKQGMHIMCMCQDIHGRLWVGTEGNGAWCWDPARALKELQAEQAWAQSKGQSEKKADPTKTKLYGWSQFTRVTTGGKPEEHGPVLTTGTPDVNSLGDDCIYALACDKQGRIWTGHLNHGVSVYDGRQIPIKQPEKGYEGWRNYDVLSGPLGERVFDIKVNPVDGDVWMATSAGLSRYRVGSDLWSYYTRQDGLPADQVQALAFLKDGSVVAGTQCDGLGIAAPVTKEVPAAENGKELAKTLEYPAWRHVTTPDNSYDLPKTPVGIGLPSNLINDLLVTRDGTLWVATTTGIAKSQDNGRTWVFLRGEDWAAKLEGLEYPPSKQEIDIARQLVPPKPQALLLEDYTTCLSEDVAGDIWIGHWRRGLEVMNAKGERLTPGSANKLVTPSGAYVRAVSTKLLGCTIIGCYGEGVIRGSKTTGQSMTTTLLPVDNFIAATAPKPATPPTEKELVFLAEKTSTLKSGNNDETCAMVLCDDWITWGDWVGRYGNDLSILCAMCSPLNYVFTSSNEFIIAPEIGFTGKNKDDGLRHWLHWIKTENHRCLYTPTTAVRRQSDWDDHGEAYPYTLNGPGILMIMNLPKDGTYKVALFFNNYNGQEKSESHRDYLIKIEKAKYKKDFSLYYLPDRENISLNSLENNSRELISQTRINYFSGGSVYKQFIFKGSDDPYIINIDRNYSFNTIISGIFVENINKNHSSNKTSVDDGCVPLSYFLGGNVYEPPKLSYNGSTNINDLLFKQLNVDKEYMIKYESINNNKNIILRMLYNNKYDKTIIDNFTWIYCLWNYENRNDFENEMSKGWFNLQMKVPVYRLKKHWPYSPNTFNTNEEWINCNKTIK